MKAKQSGSPDYLSLREWTENRYSQFALMAGFISGTLLLVICLALYATLGLPDDSAYQLFLGLTGLWWLVLGAVSVESFQHRPGPPRPPGQNFLFQAWGSIGSIFREIRTYPQAFMFLLYYFFWSDGVSTISNAGILFAQQDLCMGPSEMVFIALLIPACAAAGNYGFLAFQRITGLSLKTMLVTNLYFFFGLALWGCTGLLNNTFGLHQKWEIYVFGLLYGVNLGSVQSYSRVIFTDFIPSGSEAQWFSLYGITDRGSSWIGPLIVSIITQTTGTLRYGMVYLAFALMIPTILVHVFIDHRKGMEQSGRFHPGPGGEA